MKITVTAEDINLGVKLHCSLHPVARAINRALRENGVAFDIVRVGPHGHGSYSRGQHWVDFALPPEAQLFVERFDHFHEVQPFEFELNITPTLRGPRRADEVYST